MVWALGALLAAGTLVRAQAQTNFLTEKPLGWASTNGGTTGGAGGTVTEVTNLADFQRLAKASGKQVILVKGSFGANGNRVEITSDKTVFGLPGATFTGGLDIKKGVSNVIVRNLKIIGPGAHDVDGVDGITVQGCSRVWLDHIDIADGEDGNLDITNEADLVTVSWSKFSYTSKSTDHQFCTLIGSSDDKTTDRGKLRVTLHHNWYAQGNKERMPRVRFGQVHVANNLFASGVANHYVRAGIEADLLVEGNAFFGPGKAIDQYENNFKAITQRNNQFGSGVTNTEGKGTAFTPGYTMTLDAASSVEARIKGQASGVYGAGATLPDPRTTPTVLAPLIDSRTDRTTVRGMLLLEALPGGAVYTPELLLGRMMRDR